MTIEEAQANIGNQVHTLNSELVLPNPNRVPTEEEMKNGVWEIAYHGTLLEVTSKGHAVILCEDGRKSCDFMETVYLGRNDKRAATQYDWWVAAGKGEELTLKEQQSKAATSE